jgi:hypothetical protein
MVIDDIRKALDGGRIRHAAELFMALRHFAASLMRLCLARVMAGEPGIRKVGI